MGLLRAAASAVVTVPVVVDAPGDVSCREWLDTVATAVDEADKAFGHLAPDEIELLIGQERDGGRRTLFSVLVADESIEPVGRTLDNDVTVDTVNGSLHVLFDDRLFDRSVIDEWTADVAFLFEALGRGQEIVSHVLNDAVTARTANVARARLYAPPSVAESVAAAVIRDPDAPAVVTADATVTYGQFRDRYLAIARTLVAERVKLGDRVGLFVAAGPTYVASLVATLHVGAVPVPLDAQSPTRRLGQAATAANFRVLLANQPRLAEAKRICALVPQNRTRVVEISDDEAPRHEATLGGDVPVAVAPEASGYILFTSGSTGIPKGVVQTRRTLDSVVDWQVQRSGAGTRPRTLQRSALSFDVALQEILSTLADGGTLLVPADGQRQDLQHTASVIQRWKVERVFIPPSGLHALLAAVDASLLSSLREVVCAGEPLVITASVRRVFREIDARLDNQYGPTETHVCTAEFVEGDPFTWPDHPSIGAPVPGDTARVVSVDGHRLPVGTPGELVISGQTVACGYLHGEDPKFVRETGEDGISVIRSYRTGDIVKERPDGTFEFLLRGDEQVKVRGYRVELGEVEAAALATGRVTEVVAFPLGKGSTVERLGLAVVPTAGADDLDRGALLREMADRLPPYMMPRPAEIVVRERLESTSSGKADRRLVAEFAESQFRAQVSDSGDAEQMVRSLWCRCLGVDEFDEDATFVALGGDSLAAVDLAASLQDAVGVTISLRELLAGTTLRHLQAQVGGAHTATGTSLDAPEKQIEFASASVTLPRFGTIRCVSSAEAKHLYLDVVASRNYEQFGIADEPLKTVLDVGANIGVFALAVLDRHPRARVIALEPHPAFAEALRANLGDRAHVIEAAAAASRGEATLYMYDQMPAMSSLQPEPDYDYGLMATLIDNQLSRVGAAVFGSPASVAAAREISRSQAVRTVRLSDVLSEYGWDRVSLVKVDVQHGEEDVLAGLDDADWARVDRVVVEVQDRGTQLAELQRLLQSRGFETAVHTDPVLHAGSAVRFLYGWVASRFEYEAS
ncbi:FkbM family methyltransferase [Lentzea sp. NPDC034063]|uniref:FkbM family methyltransferase n=1 Tax=unclassified Lentzea TaxID=2643253 RepID=UPI0033CA108F